MVRFPEPWDYSNAMSDVENSGEKPRPFVLLGAGFSKAISDAMPVMWELAPRVLHKLELPPTTLDRFARDLEQWLSFLSADQPWLSDAENLSNRALFVRAAEAVRDVIEVAESKATSGPCPSWLMRLVVDWCATEATVVTFNYDLLVERVITELRLADFWPDVYRTPLVDRTASLQAGMTYGHAEPPGNVLGLIKLHGSINWGFSGLNSAVGEAPCLMGRARSWSAQRSVTNTPRFRALYDDLQPMIVPPTGTKATYYAGTSLRAQWRRAAEDLRNASSVTLIGYSFPATDLATRHFFASAAAGKEVTVVDRNASVAETVQDLSDEAAAVNVFSGPSALSDYVGSECGDLYRWGVDSQQPDGTWDPSGGWYEINGERFKAPAELVTEDGQTITDQHTVAGAQVAKRVPAVDLNLAKPFAIYDGLAHWSGWRTVYTLPSHSEDAQR